MYVDYATFIEATADTMTEAEYARIAPITDAVIDTWTQGRVGRAVANGETLPALVVTLYSTIAKSVPNAISDAGGAKLTSFSNGVDSYSFEANDGVTKRLWDAAGWLLNLLPIEWSSTVANYEGGSDYEG